MTNKQTKAAMGSRRLSLAVALAAVMLTAVPAGKAHAQKLVEISAGQRTAMVNVSIGKSADVRTDVAFTDITVGDPEIADVNVLTDRSLSILGRKSGTTRVTAYGEGRKVIGIFDVEVTYDTSMLSSEITRRFSHANIRVTTANAKILLTGTSPDAVTLDQALSVAKQFGPDVINSVQVLAPQQVMLEVRFVEASRTASRELGVNWNVFSSNNRTHTGSNNTKTFNPPNPTPGIGEVMRSLPNPVPFGAMVQRMTTNGVAIDLILKAMEEQGVVRSLAEPNLVALSGDTASFLAGGEFPVPVPGPLGTIAIEYKRYGVGLGFTPTVLKGGLINLRIEPEVSQLDQSNPVLVAGIQIPPLIVRRASTTVELRDGQSFVIGGLLQNNSTTQSDQLPWLGDVPILGALFSSRSYQKSETDLAIIITPRLVRPARPGDPVKTPLDKTLPGNDVDFFLMGKSEIRREAQRLASGATHPLIGHILEIKKTGGEVVSVKN